VLGSYGLWLANPSNDGGALWGSISGVGRALYTVSMLLAAAGYFAFAGYLLRLDPERPAFAWINSLLTRRELLVPASGSSFCEWKGHARYFTLRVGDREARRVAWSYHDPSPAFRSIRDHLAFYASPLDKCTVAGEPVHAQPGGFYGGWITADVVGPFKGEPGTEGW
jgi:hypothetical protein